MYTLDLTRPHGFLMWRGKKTAVLRPANDPLPHGELLEVATGGERFGVAVLGKPARMMASEAKRKEYFAEHRVYESERETWWPGETEFLHYPVESFEPHERIVVAFAGLKGAAGGEDCPECVNECGGWCRLHDVEVAAEKSCADWEPLEDWRGCGEKEGEEMPYDMEKRDDEYCVVKEGSGETVKCHPTQEKAEAHLAALRINVEAEEKKTVDPYTQDDHDGFEAEMVAAEQGVDEEEAEKAVAKPERDSDHPTESTDLPGSDIKDDGGIKSDTAASEEKERGEGVGQGGEPQGDGGADVCTCPSCGAEFEKEKGVPCNEGECPECGASLRGENKAGRRIKKGMRERLKEAFATIRDVLSWADYEDAQEKTWADLFKEADAGVALKMVNGEPWLRTWSANAFIDRDQEIFSTKGLEKYVAAAEKADDRGYFNFWHVPGTDFAEKRWQGVIGRFLIEMGPFLDTEFGRKARTFFENHPDSHPDIAPEGWGASVEYKYLADQRKEGVYEDFWITRTSVLPRSRAANTETKGGVIVALTEKQKQGLETIDPEGAEELIRAAEGRTKELEPLLAHKATSPAKVASALRKLAKSADGDMASKLEELASALGEEDEEMDEEEKGQEAQEPQEETQEPEQEAAEAEIDLAALADELVKRFDVHLQPIAEMERQQTAQGEQIAELQSAMKAFLEGQEAKVDGTRFSLSLEKRASRAKETQLDDDDPLMDEKPEMTKAADGSGASHFFPEK